MKRPYSLTARLAAVAVLALATIVDPIALQRRLPGIARQTAIVDGRVAMAGEVLVKYRRPLAPFERAQLDQQTDADESHPVGRAGLRRVHSRRFNTAALLAFLRSHPDVEYAEPNYLIAADATIPNDTLFGQLWGMRNTGQIVGVAGTPGADIGATQAWDISTGSRSIVVAITDTGIDYAHPDLATNVWSAPAPFSVVIAGQTINCPAGTHGFNAITKTCAVADVYDDNGHGTHVAGTIGALGNNARGVAGVNWATTMMISKFLDSMGNGTLADSIDAIDFVVQAAQQTATNVRVINNSWSSGGFSQALLDQINIANSRNMLFVVSAGNNTSNNDVVARYPAGYNAPNVIAVASTDNKDQLASNSNWGAASVHLAAPGVNIASTYPDGLYQYLSGTSMAAPHVSGAAALVLSMCATASTLDVKNTLLATVDRIPLLNGVVATGGRLNVNNAVRTCLPNFAMSATPAARTDAGRTGTTFSATATPSNGFAGTVTFSVSGLPPATSASFNPTSVSGSGSTQLTLTPSQSTPSGTYPLTITGTSGTLVHTTSVTLTIGGASTTTSVSSNSQPSVYGSGVTFTATVSGSGTPTGSVTFMNGGTTLGSSTLDGVGHATLMTSTLTAGTRQIAAVYSGDAAFAGSTSSVLQQVVNPAPLTVTANNQTRAYGAANPTLTVGYSGFVNGDTTTSLTTSPTVTTTAGLASPVGTYPITASGAVAPNYTIAYVAGTLTVTDTAPVASNATVTIVEDTPTVIALNASDLEGSPLTYSILTEPVHGTLTGTAPNLTYTPELDYNGGDSFTFKASDGLLDSNVATVTITVTPVDDAPVAADDDYSAIAGTPLVVESPGVLENDTDVDSEDFTAILVTPPQHGSLILDAQGGFTYTPAPQYSGVDFFTYKGNDGERDSNVATVTIGVNVLPPAVGDEVVTTDEDTPVTIDLGTTNVEGAVLTYAVVTPPAHGTLSGIPPALTYVPAPNYNGIDWFSFKANDGVLDSSVAVVAITVSPVNDAPVAADDSYATDQDLVLTVAGPGVLGNDSDADGAADTVEPVIVAWDASLYGNVQGYIVHYGTEPGVYTESVDVGNTTVWAATDLVAGQEYYFAVSSYASEGWHSGLSDEVSATAAAAAGGESSTLAASLVTGPAHGTLTLNASGGFTYAPGPNYVGPDLFTYRATDGIANSNVATVTITTRRVNHAPVANGQSVSGVGNAQIPVTVTASDPDGDALTYRVTVNPTHGSVSGSGPNFVYTHTPGYTGQDSFSFVANDGAADGAPAVVSITVFSATNRAPSAEDQWISLDEDTTSGFTALAGDPDGDRLTYRIVRPPPHGKLSGTAPNLIYTPDPDFNGWDYFTFVASDGMYDSNEATVNFWVSGVNDPPVAQNLYVTAGMTSPMCAQSSNVVCGQLVANDAEGDWLYYDIVTQPQYGTVTINHSTGDFTYTKNPGSPGHDTFTFTAYDALEQGNVATVDIVIGSS